MENKKTELITVEIIGIDDATKKAERYIELLKEAKTLADELASADFEIGLEQVTESSSKDIIPIGDQTVMVTNKKRRLNSERGSIIKRY
ncbi:TPA: hypothetical protein ACWP80_002323 [Enterococcus faecium]